MSLNYYDRAGQPITRDEWGSLLADDGVQQVARDYFAGEDGGVTVSTVWLGLDHQWGEGPPVIFETMVFGGPLNEEMWRYCTEAEALAGHAALCAAVQAS